MKGLMWFCIPFVALGVLLGTEIYLYKLPQEEIIEPSWNWGQLDEFSLHDKEAKMIIIYADVRSLIERYCSIPMGERNTDYVKHLFYIGDNAYNATTYCEYSGWANPTEFAFTEEVVVKEYMNTTTTTILRKSDYPYWWAPHSSELFTSRLLVEMNIPSEEELIQKYNLSADAKVVRVEIGFIEIEDKGERIVIKVPVEFFRREYPIVFNPVGVGEPVKKESVFTVLSSPLFRGIGIPEIVTKEWCEEAGVNDMEIGQYPLAPYVDGLIKMCRLLNITEEELTEMNKERIKGVERPSIEIEYSVSTFYLPEWTHGNLVGYTANGRQWRYDPNVEGTGFVYGSLREPEFSHFRRLPSSPRGS